MLERTYSQGLIILSRWHSLSPYYCCKEKIMLKFSTSSQEVALRFMQLCNRMPQTEGSVSAYWWLIMRMASVRMWPMKGIGALFRGIPMPKVIKWKDWLITIFVITAPAMCLVNGRSATCVLLSMLLQTCSVFRIIFILSRTSPLMGRKFVRILHVGLVVCWLFTVKSLPRRLLTRLQRWT